MIFEVPRQFFEKNLKYQISSESVQWELSSMRTDMTKVIFAFSNFANAPQNVDLLSAALKCT
jgi:hypothetical protein